jgi:hypothetical protein
MSKNEQKRAEGAAEEIGGKIKQGIGKVIGNEQMQAGRFFSISLEPSSVSRRAELYIASSASSASP